MSDSEEESFGFFGKPLQPYDEDAFPKKKPISIEEQVATDAQGRRRFHGAFTGGFSAGFYNTVGSLEGWLPGEFRSTREEKAENVTQRPEDFMDDEDMGEFGIAPQTVKATSDYNTSKKRKRKIVNEGPIPGEPVLHSLLTSGNETIGYLLLKNVSMKGRKTEDKVYGCEMPSSYEISRDDDVDQYPLHPIYTKFLLKPKCNSYGLGYTGLDKSHINLFQSANLVVKEQNNKKLSIAGQAFGVGAFEDEDEDIYVREDMSKYDFELTNEKASKKDSLSNRADVIFDEFIAAKQAFAPLKTFLPPAIPHSFTGKHKMKKSRFEPLPEESLPTERKEMNPEIRAKYLGEDTPIIPEAPKKTPEKQEQEVKEKEEAPSTSGQKTYNLFESSGLVFDRFVTASEPEDISNILEPVKPSDTTHGTQEMRDAARMKMFGPLTRITEDWQPCSLLCRRFNVPEPQSELNASKNRKRTKNLIFEYERHSDWNLEDLKPGLTEFNKDNEKNVEDSSMNVLQTEKLTNSGNDVTSNQDGEKGGEELPKTDEIVSPVKDITERIDIDKNVDLFKAVFLSSSEESEDEDDEKTKEVRSEEMKDNVLSDSLLPQIRPLKQGILSNMDFSIFNKPNLEQDKEDNDEGSVQNSAHRQSDDGSYGPKLPEKSTINLSKQLPLKQHKDEVSSDEWVEISETNKCDKERKKKHKSKKKSHKKSRKHSKNR